MPGSVTAAAGLFLVVFGFSHAETSGWANAVTLGSLAGAAVLLGAFVLIAQRTGHPLLPLRIVLNRNRGGAYSAIVMAAISIFGVFLFLTYYLQLTKGFSPVKTGLAFLPLVLFILIASISANVRLLPLVGARVLVTCGVLLGGLGMFYLTQITPSSGQAAHVLPALPVIGIGIGFGLVLAPAMNIAANGVARTDAGIASAMVNTMQQVGGSVGTALLSTIAASATTSYLTTHAGAATTANAAVYGYTTAFTVSGSVFIAGAVILFLLLERHGTSPAAPSAASVPDPAHASD